MNQLGADYYHRVQCKAASWKRQWWVLLWGVGWEAFQRQRRCLYWVCVRRTREDQRSPFQEEVATSVKVWSSTQWGHGWENTSNYVLKEWQWQRHSDSHTKVSGSDVIWFLWQEGGSYPGEKGVERTGIRLTREDTVIGKGGHRLESDSRGGGGAGSV